MQVTVQLQHSLLRRRAQATELRVELGAGSTVDQALAEVQRTIGELAPSGLSLVTAVNGQQVPGDHELADGDCLLLILGMSGGRRAWGRSSSLPWFGLFGIQREAL